MLEGIIRESIDKKATKSLRRDGYLIANIYGRSIENINAAFKKNEFIKYVKNKPSLKFEVKLGAETYDVIIQDYQKDPVTSDLLHVDLRILVKGEKSVFMVPVKTVGSPVGLKNKGVLIFSKRRLKVECFAENLPDSFVLDISKLDVGNSILLRDIVAPEGVTLRQQMADAVVGVIKAK